MQRSKATAAQPAPDMVEVFVDGRPVSVVAGSTVLQVKENNHLAEDVLSSLGNLSPCLVET